MESSAVYAELYEMIWRDRVWDEIITTYGKTDIESMYRIFIYLGMRTDKARAARLALIKILQCNPAHFKEVTDEIVVDTKSDDKMNEIYDSEMIKLIGELGAGGAIMPSKKNSYEEDMGFEVIKTNDIVLYDIRKLLRSVIPVSLLRQIISNHKTILSVDEFVGLINKSTGTIVMVGLASLHIGLVVMRQLWHWWNGRITGVRCVKEIIDSTVMVTAGVMGGMAGGAIGLCAGPAGAVVCGIIEGYWSANRAAYFSEKMTRKLFGIPKDIALENAYKYFGVDMYASNKDINTAFRNLCLQHHPDKGGKSEDFIELQLHMVVIKLGRGDMTMLNVF